MPDNDGEGLWTTPISNTEVHDLAQTLIESQPNLDMGNSTLALGFFAVGIVLVLLAIFVVGLNYSILYVNRRNRKRGNDGHISMIILVPQILLILAGMLFQHFPVYPVSGWLLLCVALLDPGAWSIARLPFMLRPKK